MTITDNVKLANIAFDTVLHYKVILSPLHILIFGGKLLSTIHIQGV